MNSTLNPVPGNPVLSGRTRTDPSTWPAGSGREKSG
jgi:hypothetical protein